MTIVSDDTKVPPSEIELAWAAGFIDGEGCIRWSETRKNLVDGEMFQYGVVSLRVGQIERTTLERCQRALGGIGNIQGPYQSKIKNAKPVYSLAIMGGEAIEALQKLRKYLSKPKTFDLDTTLHVYENYKERLVNKRLLRRSKKLNDQTRE